MVLVGSLQKNILTFVNVIFYVSGISVALHLKGNLVVFFPSEMPTVTLASKATFCVARQDADPVAIQAGLDWACGLGLVNCLFIQPNMYCYVVNNIAATASYVYNAYYQANRNKGGTCSFGNTAMLTHTDPSHGSCLFPGSPESVASISFTSGSGTPPSLGFMPPGSASFVAPGPL